MSTDPGHEDGRGDNAREPGPTRSASAYEPYRKFIVSYLSPEKLVTQLGLFTIALARQARFVFCREQVQIFRLGQHIIEKIGHSFAKFKTGN
jgi:hypothetical protein